MSTAEKRLGLKVQTTQLTLLVSPKAVPTSPDLTRRLAAINTSHCITLLATTVFAVAGAAPTRLQGRKCRFCHAAMSIVVVVHKGP
jgi:hypothetical protein